MWTEQEVSATYERGSLTRLQAKLLIESIRHINSLAVAHGAPVLHATVHTAPTWYLEPLSAMVRESSRDQPLVRWCGRVPVEAEYSGPESNEHSGSHFTPQLNKYYATKIAAWITACS